MQRRRTQKILSMIPPESSGSSGNESSDENVDYASNYDSSSLSSNADENELDLLLKDFELNPIDEVTREFFGSIDENIIEEEISTTNFSPTFGLDILMPSTSRTSPLPEAEFISPQPSTSAVMSSKSKQSCIRTSKRILNYNVRTPPIPLPSPQPSPLPEAQFVSSRSSRNYKVEHMQFKWKSEKQFNFGVEIPNYEFHTNNKEVLTPYAYFKRFFSDDIFDLIVQEKLSDFLAVQLWMGVNKLPAYTDYWSNLMGVPKVQDIMPLKKYQKILRSLHFQNNDECDPNDRFYKIRPFLNKIRHNCLNQEEGKEGTRYSIDEMMIPYKGTKAGSRRQYIKSKPKKWGFKFFIRAGINGQVFDILPYGGESTFTDTQFSEYENKYFGLGGKVILALASTIPRKPLSVIYYDNFFTSPELIYHLRKKYGILSLGTVQQNRLRNCPLLDEKMFKKKGRGSYSAKCDKKKNFMVVKWFDNKSVCLASSYVGVHPLSTTRRYNKTTKSRVDVSMPQIVKHYNSHMGVVDLADMLIAIYRTNMKTHK
ncbi:piggyBac transposable element-derived protein 3-like, partial [Myzus persicae]|uniref:piggyBac transposable element-derived protein 3-like n=1 Tax=Myzus persicae TaxID=13164 RepID=UPI000B935012